MATGTPILLPTPSAGSGLVAAAPLAPGRMGLAACVVVLLWIATFAVIA